MTSCSMLKVLTAAASLATAVGLAADASALSGLTGDATAKLRDVGPLLELARSQVRDHRDGRGPGSHPPARGRIYSSRRWNGVRQQKAKSPWIKKTPSRY